MSGFTGRNCENELDECESNPCIHGGSCIDWLNQYSCTCQSGRYGYTCNMLDPCSREPCQSNGSCIASHIDGSIRCKCLPEFTGSRCETEVNKCLSDPCRNGGTCTDDVNGYVCHCVPGFTGKTCTEIDHCERSPCINGNCSNTINSFACTCYPRWTGRFCHNSCQPGWIGSFCNGGCPAGFTGYNCNMLDPCSSEPCQNNGSCITNHIDGSIRCKCLPGFTGSRCEIDIDECNSDPCENGQICMDRINNYRCYHTRPPSTTSTLTTSTSAPDIDECLSDPCRNGGTCTDDVNGYVCHCVPGFTGTTCTEIDHCESSPCINGNCSNNISSFACTCNPGWTGTFCHSECVIGQLECEKYFCSQNHAVCLNGAICQNNEDGFNCICPQGFTGRQCKSKTDECSPNSCKNGGKCVDWHLSYTCNCSRGFAGLHCEKNIDECLSNPCPNGDTCYDEVNGYQCVPSFVFGPTSEDIGETEKKNRYTLVFFFIQKAEWNVGYQDNSTQQYKTLQLNVKNCLQQISNLSEVEFILASVRKIGVHNVKIGVNVTLENDSQLEVMKNILHKEDLDLLIAEHCLSPSDNNSWILPTGISVCLIVLVALVVVLIIIYKKKRKNKLNVGNEDYELTFENIKNGLDHNLEDRAGHINDNNPSDGPIYAEVE